MNLISRPVDTTVSNDRRTLLEEQLRQATAEPETVPLSFAQQRLWLLDQLEPDSALYNVPLALELSGPLHVEALQKALGELIRRHEILRTRFKCIDEMPVQVVESSGNVTFVMHDVIDAPESERESHATRLVREEINRPFDLSTGPLLKAMLVRFSAERHWFVLTFHHIVCDEWSLRICLEEIAALYDSAHRGRVSGLADLPIQYADYALWQRDRLAGEIGEKQLEYWRKQLQGTPPPLELPADFPRGVTPTFRGNTLSHTLPPRLSVGLKDIAGRSGTSLFMVLLAAFKTLLHRYTQQTDLVIGSPIAGRNQLETEDLIGFFVNTLVLRTSLDGNPSFTELLHRVRETTLAAYANQDLPFEKLVEALRPERSLNHNPFTRLMFAVQTHRLDEIRWPGLKARLIDVFTETAKFDLTFIVQELEHNLVARVEYNTALFREDTMQRLLMQFETLLDGIATQPQRRLSELSLLSESEKSAMLCDWNATARDYPRDRSVAQLFEAQAAATPDAVAVSYGKETLTYAELNSRANQLARHLLQFGVGPEVPVGLCVERSPSLLVGMLAILKAGGAYVPLDPSYPKARLAHMLGDAGAPVLITQQHLLAFLPRTHARVICINSDWELIARQPQDNLQATINGNNTAYIIYTSGSTGQPKGVAVPHRAISRLVLNTDYIQIDANDCIAQASNTSFDAATFEIWGALLNGARLAGISFDVALSPEDFARELREQKISVLFLTTALFNQIAADQSDAFSCARVLLFGGEAVDPRWIREVLKHPPQHLLHVYGPTENTTFSTWHEIKAVTPDAHTIPIGRPIANSQCYVLDSNLNPVPVGVPGELHVAGDGLANGYWKQPELTARKFIPNPWSQSSENRWLYKTGDLVRWLADGSIEFVGRIDSQVKLRGFRVELGEIENILSQHPGIRNCAVTVHSHNSGDRKLAAYFVSQGRKAPSLPELRDFLKQKLPDYMIPSSFVRLDALPLTPNGKVDRKSLPEPERVRPELEKRYATPQDAVEVELTRIWENVLGIKPIGIQDKFFELGGHSLLAVRVISQIEKHFGRKLKLATIFQAQTIEQLAAILRKEIQEDSAISGTSIVEIQPKGTRPPLFFIHGAGGGMFWGYVNLSRHLGPDQPVYGLRSRGLDGREEFESIEEMARHYIADMRVIQPRGPYHLGGYCFGGNVAYEMARQLEEQGEEVRTLALFNCAPANSSYSRLSFSPRWFFRFGVNLCYWMRYFLGWSPEQRREFFRWKVEMLQRRATRLLGNADQHNGRIDASELVDLSSFSDDQRQLWEQHIYALVHYHPRPFQGKVQLFRSPGHPWLCSFEDDYGWGEIARSGVEIRVVPGMHEQILEEPCVASLANALSEVLTRQNNVPVEDTKPAASPAGPMPNPEWNQVRADYPVNHSYTEHFEAQVKKTPHALALRFQDQDLTYAELNARANQLAHRLKALGAGPEVLIAVCLERSIDLPVSLLAILKSGAAYLPLDRSYPKDRLAYMLSDSGARVLITTSDFTSQLDAGSATVICLNDPMEQKRIAEHPGTDPRTHASPLNLAYVIYTSGSTGAPKGVQITHRSLLNHNFAVAEAYRLGPSDRVLQFSPFSFDISVEELFPSWISGCALVMRSDDDISSVHRFLSFIAKEKITAIDIPTAYWHEIVDHLRTEQLPESLRLVVIGGEKATDDAWQCWKERARETVQLINTYGPTEATVSATLHIADRNEKTLPIGKPLPNTQALILDANLQPVPVGAEGELHIGGAGLARGYLNRPDLTASKFIPNPFPEIASERLYKTGDVARFRPDGTIEFAGRTDEQVKIRGFRIELGEIETALRSHPAIKDAVVIAREDIPGKKRLVSYIVPRNGNAPGVSELLQMLKSKLPPYMVPSAFVPLPSLPMTPSGKVDRKNLPAPGDDRPELAEEYAAPRTPIETVIANIWSEVLGINKVGIKDNFFDLGGHSLLAIQVISRIREALQVEVPLGSLFTFPTVATLAESLSETATETQPVLPASAMQGKRLPLTDAQRRIWFLDHFEPQQSSYNIPTVLRLRGPLNLNALEQAFTELARRHEALRALFPSANGEPTQIICEPKPIQLPVTDLRHLPQSEREERANAMAVQEGRRSYALSSPMLRPFLWQLAENDHLLLIVTHELACDAYSARLLVKELTALYGAFATSTAPALPDPAIRYEDIPSHVTISPERIQDELAFWKRELQGAPALLELPTDRPRPPHQRDDGARQNIRFSSSLTASLQRLGEAHGCDLFCTLLAGFQTLLARYSGSSDIVVGSLLRNRNRPELNGTIAKIENTVVLRNDLSGSPSFSDLLRKTGERTRTALAAGDFPFELILDELRPERNASYTPVFQVMFTFEPEPLPAMNVAGLEFAPVDLDNKTSKLDLRLHLEQSPDGLRGFIEYNTDLFEPSRMERMADHLLTLLSAAESDPAQSIATLPLMPEAESRRVLNEWNATTLSYPASATLISLFEQQAAATPQATALISGTDRLSYAELNARANQLAHHLASLGVGPGVLVGICLERSWRLLVGILGVLKAGGAYVPLDPAYPKERLAFILQDARAPILLTQESLRGFLPDNSGRLLCLDSDWSSIHIHSQENPACRAQSSDLAYVIYTSGSTGQPKGVAIENRAAVALIFWAREVFNSEELAGVLASTSICFDLSIFEMFVPLCAGGKVILAQNALALPSLDAAAEVTLINTVPSAIRELLRIRGIPPGVRVVNLAGEPLATSIVNQIHGETNVEKVYDLYGPSETTTYSTFTLRRPSEAPTIGKPLANEQVYVLDPNRQPVPVGVPGELYIGGDKLARGYLNRPELTAEKFVSNPFQPGRRLYRTGDLARWRADGNLEFLGRIDHQVKIRGFRIELGEIETAYRKHPDIRDVIVLARETPDGPKRLVGYLVCRNRKRVPSDELRRFGKEHLPEYMIPSAFVLLDELPLTPNGKVNRKALPDPEGDDRDFSTPCLAPRTPVEAQLAAIWREVLRLRQVGVQDNFFELGGDSLLAIQVISRVRETCKVELPLFSLFDAPTIELLATGLESGTWTQNQRPVLPLQRIPREGKLPVSFVQERLWFLHQLDPGDYSYNVAVALRIKGPLNTAALQRAFNMIAERHESLRSVFAYEDGLLTQRIKQGQTLPIDTTDLSHPADQSETRLEQWLRRESQHPFDLAAGPLTRIGLAALSKTDHALLVVMHHTISDGWSLTLLFQELELIYAALAQNKPAPVLPELPLQYADFAAWKRQQMQGALLDQELDFWKRKLAGAPDSIALPFDRAPSEKTTNRGGRQLITLPKSISDTIAQVSQRQNSTAFTVLTAALCAVLEKWSHQRDLVVGTVVAGRNRREMENLIGCFMNFLPIRTRMSGEESGIELLAKVKASVLEAQDHQDCPFERIVEAVNPERHKNQNPLYNVALLLQNFPTEMFRNPDLQVTTIPVDLEAALLDLRFEAEWNNGQMELACEYKSDLFDDTTIQELLACYQQFLEIILFKPETRLSDFRLPQALDAQARTARSRDAHLTIAVASTFTAEPVEDSLRYWAKELELPAKVEFAGYNQVFQELLDPGSLLNGNSRGMNVLLIRPEDWLKDAGGNADRSAALKRVAGEFVDAVKSAASHAQVPILTILCPRSVDSTTDTSLSAAIDEAEATIATGMRNVANLHLITSDELLRQYSVRDYYDASGDELGRVPFTPVFFTALGTAIMRRLHVLNRTPHKVIVLDLDNTLWSGVCGEDGAAGICIDAPRKAFQEFMRAQQESGRLLAVCSKNNPEDVSDVFAQRLDMPLRHEHFVAWKTNWLPKSENLKALAQELNLGLDSFIFIDDNPVECAEVEANCPEVLTLQLPEDPEQIPAFLQHCWVFDHTNVTTEDRKRGEMYRENLQREQLRSKSSGLADFIASLQLQIDITPMTDDQLARVSQLTHRTNQFNCTTIRRSETEIRQLLATSEIFTVSVRDRFGDYGLVGVMIASVKETGVDVDTFLLSCRVLGRGVEHAMLARLGTLARERELEWVTVHFVKSEKNKPAHDFLENVGANFRQALNGGFVYRFPAATAAKIAFTPKESPRGTSNRSDESEKKTSARTGSRPELCGNRFRRYRQLAFEAADPTAIHATMESRVTRRTSRPSDLTPPRSEMEHRLCDLWQQLLRIEKVGIHDNFFELGGHSLLAVRLFAELEKLTGRKYPLVTVFQAPTIEQLAAVLDGSNDAMVRSPIVPVQPNGDLPPVFLAHGAGGDVLWGYANLAQHLPPDQPIYGIKSRGQIGLEEFDTIEEMARYYVEEIQKIQPHGPYYVGGYCLGGNVAYEMARQLKMNGEEVALVALIDASPSNAGYERPQWWNPKFPFRFARNFWYWLEDFRDLSSEDRRRFFIRKGRIFGRKLKQKFSGRNGSSADVDLEEVIDPSYFPEHELRFWEIHLRALVTHTEKYYPGTVTLIRTRGQPMFCSLAEDFCWGKVAGRVEIRRIPGSHENIFMEPNVKHLAHELQDALAAARKTQPRTDAVANA